MCEKDAGCIGLAVVDARGLQHKNKNKCITSHSHGD